MKKLLLSLIVVVLPLKIVLAQTPYTVQYVTQAGVFSVTVLSPEEQLKKINGSPYWNEEKSFTLGSLVADDTILVPDLMLRYNVYNQQFEMKEAGEIKSLQANDRIKHIDLQNIKFVNQLYYNGEYFEKGFLEIVYEGKVNIYKRYVCKIKAGYYNSTVSAGHKNDSFNHTEEYFIMTEDQRNPVKFFFGKSALLKKLGDKKESVKDYMKKNRLSIKKPNEFKKILEYYESI